MVGPKPHGRKKCEIRKTKYGKKGLRESGFCGTIEPFFSSFQELFTIELLSPNKAEILESSMLPRIFTGLGKRIRASGIMNSIQTAEGIA